METNTVKSLPTVGGAKGDEYQIKALRAPVAHRGGGVVVPGDDRLGPQWADVDRQRFHDQILKVYACELHVGAPAAAR